MTSTRLRLVEAADDGLLVGQDWPLIPDAEYFATCTGWETVNIFRSAKLFLHFQIISGPHTGRRIFMPFAVAALIGKPGSGGRFKMARRSKLALALGRLTGERLRGDRVSLQWLTHCVFKVRTRTIKRDFQQRELAPALRYTVVDEILTIEAGEQ